MMDLTTSGAETGGEALTGACLPGEQDLNLVKDRIAKLSTDKVHHMTPKFTEKLISSVEKNFPLHEQARIFEVLELALRLHGDQDTRRGDDHIVNHVLRVATRLTEKFNCKNPDLTIAALLHDSVEDQTSKLIKLPGAKALEPEAKQDESDTERVEREKEWAFSVIRNRYGEHVEQLVRRLTSADFKEKAKLLLPEGATSDKVIDVANEQYRAHVTHLASSMEPLDQEAFTIKLSDLFDNALRHDTLPTETPKDRLVQLRLTTKRAGILRYLHMSLNHLPEIHPLCSAKGYLRGRILKGYNEQYAPLLGAAELRD